MDYGSIIAERLGARRGRIRLTEGDGANALSPHGSPHRPREVAGLQGGLNPYGPSTGTCRESCKAPRTRGFSVGRAICRALRRRAPSCHTRRTSSTRATPGAATDHGNTASSSGQAFRRSRLPARRCLGGGREHERERDDDSGSAAHCLPGPRPGIADRLRLHPAARAGLPESGRAETSREEGRLPGRQSLGSGGRRAADGCRVEDSRARPTKEEVGRGDSRRQEENRRARYVSIIGPCARRFPRRSAGSLQYLRWVRSAQLVGERRRCRLQAGGRSGSLPPRPQARGRTRGENPA